MNCRFHAVLGKRAAQIEAPQWLARGEPIIFYRKSNYPNKSKIRARVEHVFAVVKRRRGFTKVRYRGLAKNACRAFTALALANIYLSRHRLMAQVRPRWTQAGGNAR
jgi:hypothetical protein